MSRFLWTIAFLSIACLSSGSVQEEPKITLTLPAMSTAQALKQLSNVVHGSFVTSPQTADDVICLRFKDVPLKLAMSRIAEAVDGTWKLEGDSYRLIRTSEQARAERSREFAQDVERFRSAIKKIEDELHEMKPWSSAEADSLAKSAASLMKQYQANATTNTWYQSAGKITQMAPMSRVLKQIAVMLDPQELAALPPFYKTVWSSSPTAMQRALPQGFLHVFEKFWRDQAEWAAAIERHHIRDDNSNLGAFWQGGFGDQRGQATGTLTTVLLTATRYIPTSALSFDLSAFDEKGRRMGQYQLTLGSAHDGIAQTLKEAPADDSEPLVTFDGESRELLDAIVPRGQGLHSISPELKNKLATPMEHDPLSFFVSPALIQAAEIRKVNMVCCLPDDAIFTSLMGTGSGIRVNQLLSRLSLYQTTCEFKDGWLIGKPTRPSEARTYRASRSVLAAYFQRIGTGQPFSVDELAPYAVTLPDRLANPLPQTVGRFIGSTDSANFSQETLRLYGSLRRSQNKQIAAGGSLISSLTPDQQEIVTRMVYGPTSNLQFNLSPTQGRRLGGVSAEYAVYNNALLHEPTVALPDGIPHGATVRLKWNVDNVVSQAGLQDGTMPGRGQMMTAENLAWQQFSQERPDLYPWMTQRDQRVDFTRLQFGQRLSLTFTFDLSTSVFMVHNVEGRATSELQNVSVEDLPEDYKKQYLKAYQNYRKANQGLRPTQTSPPTGSQPPP